MCTHQRRRQTAKFFFARLEASKLGFDGPVFVGGDFNCTLHPSFDRSHPGSQSAHDSPHLKRLMRAQEWTDVYSSTIAQADLGRSSPASFRRHHTYHYTRRDDSQANSRLDRWLVSAQAEEWVRHVEVDIQAHEPTTAG